MSSSKNENTKNKIKLLLNSMKSKNLKINTEYSLWNDIYYYIRIIISKDNFQNMKKIFDLNFNKLIYFEDIQREDGYSMKIRRKIIDLYHSTMLDEELNEFINEIIIYNDIIIKIIGENMSVCLGNKINHMHLFYSYKFISNKNISQIEMYLFKEILYNYLYRYILNESNNNKDINIWLYMKIRIEKEKLQIEEIIYRYAKIFNLLKFIENLLINDTEYKNSYFIINNDFAEKKRKNFLKLLKNIYIKKKYKDDTILNKICYYKDRILNLENTVNLSILNINESIERIINLLNYEYDIKKNKFKFWCYFSSSSIIDKHKIYNELLSYIN
jgi:hypothetical protein